MDNHRLQKRTRFALAVTAILLPLPSWGEWRITQPVSWNLLDLVSIGKTGWAIGENGILKTQDNGDSWTVYDAVGGSAIWFWNASRGLFAGRTSGIWKTEDGGKSWHQVSSPFADQDPRRFVFHDGNSGWLLMSESLWRTFDGGETWEESTLELPDENQIVADEIDHACCFGYELRDLFFDNEQEGYAVGGYLMDEGYSDYTDRGIIYRTTNGGVDWDNDSSDEYKFLDGREGWAPVMQFGGIFGIPGSAAWVVGAGESVWSRPYVKSDWLELYKEGAEYPKRDLYTRSWGYSLGFGSELNWELNTGAFLDEQTFWIAGDRILHTKNGGNTWIIELDATVFEEDHWITRMVNTGSRLMAVGLRGEVMIRDIGLQTSVRSVSWGELKLQHEQVR